MDVFLWLFLNVGVALSPLAIIYLSLVDEDRRPTLGGVLGDGFLFFFTVVLAAGLISDVAKDLLSKTHRVTSEVAVAFIIGSVVAISTTLLSYYRALRKRFSAAPGPGRGFALWSLAFSMISLILTLSVRYAAGLW